MSELEERLARLGQVPTPPVTEAQVAADLGVVRRAADARRARRASFVSLGGVVAAGVVAVVVVLSGSGPEPARGGATTTSLVAWTGEQEPGFTVTSVPRGYVLQGADAGVLAIARADDRTPIDTFAHKLVVTVGRLAEYGRPEGEAVLVAGQPAAYQRSQEGGASLQWVQGDRVVQVQQWEDVDLTREELIAFANGITVTAAAVDSHG